MLKSLLESPKLLSLYEALQQGESILIEGIWNSPKALIASRAQAATGKHILILTGANQEEVKLFHDFPLFTQQPVIDFPAWETLPSETIAPSPDIVGERYKVLREIRSTQQPHIIISNLQACLQKLISPSQFSHLYVSLKLGDTIGFEKVIKQLTEMGYQRRPTASEKGEFAIRGGILDVFPVSSPDPCRIEFWGDEVESLRLYDPIGQKSVSSIDHIEIPPAQELELLHHSKNLCSLLDYLGPNTLVIFDDLLSLEDKYASLINICGSPTGSFSGIEPFMDQLEPLQKIFLTQQPIEELSDISLVEKLSKSYYSANVNLHGISFQMFNRKLTARRWVHPFVEISDYLLPERAEDQNISSQELLASLEKFSRTDVQLHFLCSTELEEATLHKKILDARLTLPKQTHYHLGYLSSGLVIEDIKTFLFPMTEITHRYKMRRQKQRSTYHSLPTEVYEISPGDMVVHLNHGIGKFLGIEKKANHQGILCEFLTLEYAENSKLYVPLNQSYLVSKYVGAHEEIPKLHTLGGSRWKKAKEQTERAILEYATDLLDLYAKREITGGYHYPEDSSDTKAFEEDFPYTETEDQLSAIANLKVDMQSKKAMDRLICGDVGYGKTEVAMRAAFKAVVDGNKQVAVLVPTTFLAMQHFENFVDRMRHFPVNIHVLSRFQAPKQIKETLKGIAEGSVDIVIGTHRLISEDVSFKDLGLIIIDEEQRFGVKVKEHLKKIKVGIDCLTLSATPIPRTLYMSLIGARDMSVISTPPQDRLPITTIVAEPAEQTIRSALQRELARDGQAYIIHNRVETIFERAEQIKKLLPQARIVVGHGQMSSEELDTVFHLFKSGKADILIATTIVENGIDIPYANTILIDRADQFGLADLYQLRGRVGRWNRRAYAYFFVPKLRSLPELARKRLNALSESSGYGGGMKIAMRDLELRGAGNILGLEQSGHVSSIGFYLYCKLLKRTIQKLQGKVPIQLVDTKIEFPFDARLPEEYVNEVSLRMEIYQRFGEALSLEELEAIWAEVHDRFGPPPLPAEWLYYCARARIHASQKGCLSLKLEKISLTIERQQGSFRKVLFNTPKTPQEFETKLLNVLKG